MRWPSLVITLLFAAGVHAATPSIHDAYVPQPAPGQTMAVMYLRVSNPLAETLSLLSAESPLAAKVAFHTHVHADGQMKMQTLPKVELPGERETVFQPGGLHLMLFGLRRPLQAGHQVPITLTLSDGTRLEALARVRDVRR
jgi:copper(I)-binding protein